MRRPGTCAELPAFYTPFPFRQRPDCGKAEVIYARRAQVSRISQGALEKRDPFWTSTNTVKARGQPLAVVFPAFAVGGASSAPPIEVPASP
ncbi:hypothetical protein [Deinococcus hopiensis]|uniref:Uncharacterized protein n=1 Tax=Deinococcus hopiensis KR-140 TaxID=695939 RepID=A0A1W1VDK7_9DEIO|nr:hypothetical protein [Deinococcus hopiensis]SMB91290.1 hypothetical protein SAMN00790413_01080 [Deinococcus hopiensis KR-140]